MTTTANVTRSSQQARKYFEELGAMHRLVSVTGSRSEEIEFDSAIDTVIQSAIAAHAVGGKLMFIGNGGSSAIASHMAIDYWKNGRLRATAFNDPALLTCLSNDYGYEQVFAKPIEMFGREGDLLFAISSSGNSPNILRGVDAARAVGCRVVTFSGFGEDNALRKKGDMNFYVPSSSYGFVELTHLSLCHCILDLACNYPRG